MTLKVGVIGLGVMGAEHLRILRDETAGVQVTAICDADARRAKALGGGAHLYSDPKDLIAKGDVQAVVIASPDATHAELVLAALDRGLPTLCEKPLAPLATEALAIVEAEAALGRRLVQLGYMRRFDPGYVQLRGIAQSGQIGEPILLHNTHRNAAAPAWFTGAMSITNAFVHEIDISRWLLGREFTRVMVKAAPGGDPLMITLETAQGEIVTTEVFMNAAYGYHVQAQIVGRTGTAELATPVLSRQNSAGQHGHSYPGNWVPRFADAYRIQMAAFVRAASMGGVTGPSAWDGYAATAIAEQTVAALTAGQTCDLSLAPCPALYLAQG